MGLPAIIERTIDAEMELISNVLAAHPHLPPATFKASFLTLAAQNDKVAQCTPASLVNCLSTAAGLGLPMQSQLGQFFILPFKLHGVLTGTPVIGVKGYNTLGARDNYTINGEVVRDGDEFEYEFGSNASLSHKIRGKRDASRRVIAAWAMAEHLNRRPIIKVTEIEELEAVRAKSPAVKFNAKDSPWNDNTGIQLGLTAMFEKTPKRRLARSMPLNIFVMANAMETQFDLTGRPAYILPNKEAGTLEIVDGGTGEKRTPEEISKELEASRTKYLAVIVYGEDPVAFDTVDQWRSAMMSKADRITTSRGMDAFLKMNAEHMDALRDIGEVPAVMDVERYIDGLRANLP